MSEYIRRAIESAVSHGDTRFFMPGHKGRNRFMQDMNLFYDVTEIKGTDNLHAPEGAIMNAQNFTAAVYGAQHSFFLVNGSTAGIFAMLGAICKRGDKVIVDRQCHYSVINAIAVMGLSPVYVIPEYNVEFDSYTHIEPKKTDKLLAENTDAKAVFITTPTYYGSCSDVTALADIAHKYGMPLLADEAHGAHFAFSDMLPETAIQSGADCSVMSAHKTLPCITQGAFLHLNSKYIKKEDVSEQLKIFQTSSPSYLIMAALENAVHVMNEHGGQELERIIDCCNAVEARLYKARRFKSERYDVSRLVINMQGASGCEIADKLRAKGIHIEMASGNNILCIPSINNTNEEFERLASEMCSIAEDIKTTVYNEKKPMILPEKIMEPWQAVDLMREEIPAQMAIGRIAAKTVFQTPPGIPLVCPGERVPQWITKQYQGNIFCVL